MAGFMSQLWSMRMSECLLRVSRNPFAFLIHGGKDMVGMVCPSLPVLNLDTLVRVPPGTH